MAIVLQGII